MLREHPGATIIFEVKCSESLIEDIAKHGGKPLMWKTGHSLIKQKMRETGALLAGEMSGHIFFADRYLDTTTRCTPRAGSSKFFRGSPGRCSSLLGDLARYETTPEIRVACEDARKFDVVSEVRDHFRKTHDVIDVDGARVKFDGGWGLVRASNTQPVLVLRFEARTVEALSDIKRNIADVLGEYVDTSQLLG